MLITKRLVEFAELRYIGFCQIVMRMRLIGVTTAMLLASGLFMGANVWAGDDYLAPEDAFIMSAKMLDAGTIAISYTIADGYYMYRDRLKFRAVGATLGEAQIPAGKIKFDDTFQKDVETYRNSIVIRIPVDASQEFVLYATSQGCADKGLCYPPMVSEAKLMPAVGPITEMKSKTNGDGIKDTSVGNRSKLFSALGKTEKVEASSANSNVSRQSVSRDAADGTQTVERPQVVEGRQPAANFIPSGSLKPSVDEDSGLIESSLKSRRLLAIVPLFFLLGLGLSFTPCVLPMVPILSFIIVGEGAQVRRLRGFVLSITYSMGMAVVYTLLGIAAGLAGEGLAASLQSPWVLGSFALLMVGLSLSMFDVYQLQVPASIQMKLVKTSEAQSAGKLIGVFVMGAISALIVGPCVAAPLAGALIYISNTKDVVIGGGALFSMAVGMSVPLLLVGISAGSLLPRAGAWMESVKRFFGVLMIATALWMVSPVLPALVQMLAWAGLAMSYGVFLLRASSGGVWFARACGSVLVLIAAIQLVGIASGGRDVFAPLAQFTSGGVRKVEFRRVKSSAELDNILAQEKGKLAILDFYADWCVSCKEMEKLTFSDPRVQVKFENAVLLQVDVTANDFADRELLKRFKLFGPPGIIFFDRKGQEIAGRRVIGYQHADQFLHSMALAFQ